MKRNRFIYFSIVILAAVLLCFSGCKETKNNNQTLENRTITTKVGETFETSAECDVKDGYVWQISNNTNSLAANFLGSKFTAKDPTIIGSAGIQTLQFKALKKGNVKITLEYSKVGSKVVKVEKTIVLSISIW